MSGAPVLPAQVSEPVPAQLPARPPLRLDLSGWTREATQGDPRAFMALFEEAERLGYDGVWFNEFRLAQPPAPYPSPLLLAAALLARTERLRVGLSVLVLPLHQPLLLAEDLAQVGLQSGGRIDVGVGRGTDAATLSALGIEPTDTRSRFELACRHLRAALPGLPLYVAGSTAETLGFAVAQDLPLLLSLEPPEGGQLVQVDAAFAARLAGEGAQAIAARRRRLLAGSSLSRYVCIAATPGDALAQMDSLLPLLHQRRVFFAARRGVPASQVVPVDRARALREQFILGTPESCAQQIQAACERTGARQLRLVFNGSGVLGNEQALAGMRLFAREAMPALRA